MRVWYFVSTTPQVKCKKEFGESEMFLGKQRSCQKLDIIFNNQFFGIMA